METKENENSQSFGDARATREEKFVAGNPVNTVSVKAAVASAEASKKGVKAKLAEERPAMNLEQTLRMIRELSRLSHQRDKLIVTIDLLADFQLKQEDESEETSLNPFQRCELEISDDKGERFSTKNPFIIDMVAKKIVEVCNEKLAEVESQISLNR